jgi:hypothetical protein
MKWAMTGRETVMTSEPGIEPTTATYVRERGTSDELTPTPNTASPEPKDERFSSTISIVYRRRLI